MPAPQQRYRVLERIAAGGMAEVFSAESAGLEGFKKKVAIKRVLPHLAGKSEFIGMFLDEARLSAHLGHSNCVQVFDIGQGDDTYFIVMEMVDGADLKGVIHYMRERGQVFPTEEALLICVRICEGLTYAHELKDDKQRPLNIVHRDMSPPNVLMTRFGEVKIADFGLAKANSQLEESQPGIIKGKFGYLSPEAAQGKPVDHRTDIFAVGIILWEMLAGRRLFQGTTDLETVKQVQRAQIPDIRQFNPSIPDSVLRVLNRALAADPSARYPTARALGDDLNAVLFRMPRPVSSFDLSKLVVPVVFSREAAKSHKAALDSRIGSLIDQALFQFTSLDGGGSSGQSPPVSGPGRTDAPSFVGSIPSAPTNEPLDWGDSLGLSAAPSMPSSQLESLEAGNLSALEEVRMASQPTLETDGPRVDIPPHAAVPTTDASPPPKEPRKKGSSLGFFLLILLLFFLGGALGAYYLGIVPPELLERLALPPLP